ncbi:MAG: hypothetical protein WDN06_12930 [Asticcacaulis sp.]
MTTKPPSQLQAFLRDGRGLPMLNYALLFFMVMTVGATGVVALLIATFAEDKAPDWVKTHYRFQVRTFWIGVLPAILTYFAGQVLLKVYRTDPLIMFFVVLPVLAWVAARVAIGFNHLLNERPYPNPKSWLV